MEEPVTIRGHIEHVTFRNDSNGFTVAKMKISGQKQSITVVGNLPEIMAGEVLELSGEWSNHPKFGNQFTIATFRTILPVTASGIEKYLGSGLIKGIGPVMANRLVQRFGEATLEIIENQPERLVEIEGIGEKRAHQVREAWEAQKEVRDVMIFLQGHGVSAAYATKIYKQYGRKAIEVVKENPYRLAADVFGIGFITADKIAFQLGFSRDSVLRSEAGILYVLSHLMEDGHVYYPYEPLMDKSQEILGVDRDTVLKGFARLVEARRIVVEDINQFEEEFRPNDKAVYLTAFHIAEKGIALKLKALLTHPQGVRPLDTAKAVEWVQKRLNLQLAEKQCEAVNTALKQKVMVLTGGPGTGKTTIIKAILEIFRRVTTKIIMGAPTGRAAKRMSEATEWEAKTLHRLLEWSFKKMEFDRDVEHPLNADLVIMDEASMVDTMLMYHFLRAVPNGAVIILVGDVNQLPPVGPGNVLKDIIASGIVPVVELNEIFRQAMGSLIITNAHRINRGEFPKINDQGNDSRDFYFIEREEPEQVADTIVDLVSTRIPSRFGLDPVHDVQVLTPMHKGVIGAGNLNTVLQKVLNPSREELVRGGRTYKHGDKVMQIRNDYEREVFNGDIGRIVEIDPEEQLVKVDFDGRIVDYDYLDLEELILAYAVSVHKSQGSEYPAVVMPIHTAHYILLQRNLIYTAVTRAKKLVVVVGTKKALNIGINNTKTQERYTGLGAKLRAFSHSTFQA
jgi:exodeoxyribonuclease V alpha subunit